MTAPVRRINSTNVRSSPIGLRAARIGLRWLSPRAPALAARWAERLFRTGRRYDRPRWEREAIATARASRVPYEDSWLPTWTWSPETATREPRATVILIHGWEGRGSQLARFVPPLVERGVRVVAFDAPGHGDCRIARGSIVDHARALSVVAKHVGPVRGVIGHSVGGAAALFATRLGLEAERFALISPPTSPAQFASAFAQTLGLDPAVKEAMLARLETRYEMSFGDIDVRFDAARLEQPLLVVHDRDDRVVPCEEGKMLAESASRGDLMQTLGLGHRGVLRAQQVIEPVTHFLAAEAPSTSFGRTLEGELFLRESRWHTAREHR